MCLRLMPAVGTPVGTICSPAGIARRHTSGSEETGDARLDVSARTTETAPADLGQPSCIDAAGARRQIEGEGPRGGRYAAPEQARPRPMVWENQEGGGPPPAGP